MLLLAALAAGCAMSDGFDAEAWRAQQGSTAVDNPRSTMVAALERTHLRRGMPREDVHALLGPPDRRLPDSDRYRIGAAPMGIDFEDYVVEYDRDGRVAEYGVRRR